MKNVSIVFYASLAVVTSLVLMGVVMPESLESMTSTTQSFITNTLGWYYLAIVTVFVVVCVYLLVSPLGRIKLGKPEDEPEFSRPTWVAMLFSAGVGIGLIFYNTAEPISHYAVSSPTGELGHKSRHQGCHAVHFLSLGIHARAIYGSIALALA